MAPVTSSVIGNPADNPILNEIFTRFAETYGDKAPAQTKAQSTEELVEDSLES